MHGGIGDRDCATWSCSHSQHKASTTAPQTKHERFPHQSILRRGHASQTLPQPAIHTIQWRAGGTSSSIDEHTIFVSTKSTTVLEGYSLLLPFLGSTSVVLHAYRFPVRLVSPTPSGYRLVTHGRHVTVAHGGIGDRDCATWSCSHSQHKASTTAPRTKHERFPQIVHDDGAHAQRGGSRRRAGRLCHWHGKHRCLATCTRQRRSLPRGRRASAHRTT